MLYWCVQPCMGSNPILSKNMLLLYHLIEIKYRSIYWFLSFLISSIIAFIYLPTLFSISPYLFLNNRSEEVIFMMIKLALLIGFISSFPILICHFILFITPAFYAHEINKFKSKIFFWIFIIYFYWLSAPYFIFNLPSFNLIFHSETIILTPQINDFYDIIIDYFFCGFFLPILGLFNRKPLYLTVILISMIFIEWYNIIFILLLIIELNIFISRLNIQLS